MNRYSPIWSQITDSSLWCEDDVVVKVFLTMLAKKDMDDVVRGSAFNIASWAKKTEAEVLAALKVLSSPDTRRLEPQPFEGRRIERVSDGWLVLNGARYRQMMSKATRLEYKRVKQAEYRLRNGTPQAGAKEFERAHGDGDEKRCDDLSTPDSQKSTGGASRERDGALQEKVEP